MVDPFSMGAFGALAATEGIKFLYGQAAEVLRRWRDRRAGRQADSQRPIPTKGSETVLEGSVEAPAVNFEILDRLHQDIKQLAGVLGPYAGGLEVPDSHDQDLALAADGLRRALEAVYGQRITFKGENRAASGPIVIGRAETDRVAGDVAGLRARLVRSGRIETSATAKEVLEGGKVSGGEFDTIG